MKNIFTLRFCICFFAMTQGWSAYSQDYRVKGVAVDTTLSRNLSNANIVVLNAKDSILVDFARTAQDGAFSLKLPGPGKFLLFVSYPQYVEWTAFFLVDSAKPLHDFGRIPISLKARLLADVIIKAKPIAIRMKGDTTEFDAKAFSIPPNAKVDDLLKQLPGITVDQSGKITANGQTVKKVLVDGEEFFGDDPALVTQNLRGDMIDKVQVFDKKSDQAQFTGIDDGVKTKTINLKLKADKNKGYFGKVDGGGASGEFFQGQGMFNSFRERSKVSAFTNLANTGRLGLNSSDNNKYGYAGALTFIEGGITGVSAAGDELSTSSGRYNGHGIPLARTGGAHFDGKWNNGSESLNMNYRVGSLNLDGERRSTSQNNFPGASIGANTSQSFESYLFRQKLDALYQLKLDTISNLRVSVDGVIKSSRERNSFQSLNLLNGDSLLNSGNRKIADESEQSVFSSSVQYSRKFKKPRRTISLTFAHEINESNTDGQLDVTNQFFAPGGLPGAVESIDQQKVNELESQLFSASLHYTEPISKTLSLSINYGLGGVNGTAERNSFNKSASGSYDDLDQEFSNYLTHRQLSNMAGTTFQLRKKNQTMNFGTRMSFVNFTQRDLKTDLTFRRKFVYWFPQASYRFEFAKNRRLSASYNGSTVQPRIDQLQPIKINNDPLNIVLGNPNINPGFKNNLTVDYSSFKVLTGESLNLGAYYTLVTNPVVFSILTNGDGKTISQAVNLTSKRPQEMFFRATYGREVKPLNSYASFEVRYQRQDIYGFSNSTINRLEAQSLSLDFFIRNSLDKKYFAFLSFGPSYNISKSSLPNQLSNNGRGFHADLSGTIYLPYKTEFTTTANYQYQGATEAFREGLDALIINTSLSKRFLKAQNLKFAISGNDLLNDNRGFIRSTYGTTIIQNSYTTIKRYFMLSLIWDFSRFANGTGKNF